MTFTKTTEQDSHYNHLEKMSIKDVLNVINQEDQSVPSAVATVVPQIEALVAQIVKNLQKGGRLFYLGAGTSGRLGILDASECPPTFGVPHEMVIGLIAGGDSAIRTAVEFAEDDTQQGWRDLQTYSVSTNDVVVGIAASTLGTEKFEDYTNSLVQNLNYGIKKSSIESLMKLSEVEYEDSNPYYFRPSNTEVAQLAKTGAILIKCWKKK